MWRQQVRNRNPTALESNCQHLSIDAVCLTPVLTDPKPSAPRCVDQNHLIAPARQKIVHVPSFSAGFDRNYGLRLLRTQKRFQ
jgi:hypothetical protein